MSNLNNLYDELSNALLLSIYSKSKDKGKIQFKEIDFKDKAHLCLLKIAEQLRGFSTFEITVSKKSLSLFFYNLKRKLKIQKNCEYNIDINELLDEFRALNNMKDNSMIHAVYDEYYNKKGRR